MNFLNSLVKSASDFFNCYKQVDEQTIDDTEILIPETPSGSKTDKSTLVTSSQTKKDIFLKKVKKPLVVTVDKNKNDLVDMKLVMNKYTYKRIDHLREHLNVIKIDIIKEIPKDELTYIMEHVKKYCFSQCKTEKDVTTLEIKQILKNIGYRKYYVYAQLIHQRITGIPIPQLSDQETEEVVKRFTKISKVYYQCVPEHRKSFLNYSYVIHKILQLMGRHDMLYLFPLLRSRLKMKDYDEIWKKICEKLNWIYISSIIEDEANEIVM